MMKKILATFCILAAGFCARAQFYTDWSWFTVPDHPDWTYRVGEDASVEVFLSKYGIPQDGTLVYSVSDDLMPPDVEGSVELRGGRARIPVGTRTAPGFRNVRISYPAGGANGPQTHVKLAFSPERIQPAVTLPEDFDAFWKREIAAMEARPLQVREIPQPARDTPAESCTLVRVSVDDGHGVYGYLYVPKDVAPGSCPIVIFPPGAGVNTIIVPGWHRYYTERKFIRFVMEIHGLDPRSDTQVFRDAGRRLESGNGAGYLGNGIESRDTYYMKNVYLAMVRITDYLTTLPQWDGRNVVVKGGSQGGALSLVAAGLDPRVTVCIADHPALADMAAYAEPGRTGGYPHFNRQPGILTPSAVRTLAYYDVINFARRIKVPVQMSFGYNDDVCPPTTSFGVWNSLDCPKSSLITPINEHWASETTEAAHCTWLDAYLKK
ncbi:MAG: acetylxylan esterase [Bacteroidales bacterium]|nr:acetylxylan esterase [Bacteroidales bacterium]